jgi:hypothetical protein
LSDLGQETLGAARDVVQRYDLLVGCLRGRRDGPQVITVATGGGGSQFYLPRAVARLRERLPDWQVRPRVCRGRERILGTADGTYELAVVSHDPVRIQSVAVGRGELVVEELAETWLCLIARRGSKAGDRLAAFPTRCVPVVRLVDFMLIGPDSESGVRRQLEAHTGGGRLRFAAEAAGWAAAREYARYGLGAAVVDLSVLDPEDRRTFVARLLDESAGVRDYLIYRRMALSEGATALREELRQAAAAHRAEVRERWRDILFS